MAFKRISRKYLILFTLWVSWVPQQPTLERRVTGGKVRGRISRDGTYEQYFGIPYAYTDFEHRFQAPLPVRPWEGVLDAVDENIRCPQLLTKSMIFGQTDCLRVNVYVPIHSPDQPLPVMVFIHGGGFYEGSGLPAILGPAYLVKHHVILVTMNYRLNIQGFLCLRIKEAPGNAGMKDQVAALKWIQENIAEFGGDSKQVTVFGESAGAASVSLHMLSPMSQGLFQRAIVQSGSGLAPWTIQYNPVYMASLLAKTMGYNAEDPYKLYNYFKNKTDDELILTRVPRKPGHTIYGELLYTPCIEQNIPGVEEFLNETPYEILSKGNYSKVPVIIGVNDEEGILFTAMETEESLAQVAFEKAMPKDLTFPTESEKFNHAKTIEKMYMGNDMINKTTLHKYSKLLGEPYFLYPGFEEIEFRIRDKDHSVYSYLFSYSGGLNYAKKHTELTHVPGAAHADDLFYLFKPELLFTPHRLMEMEMVERMTTMWTNFAKYGNPTPSPTLLLPDLWLPTSSEEPQLFVIDQRFSLKPLWHSESLWFWRNIYRKYRRKEII